MIALIDLSILVSLWNIRRRIEDALFPKANDTRQITKKEQQQRIMAVIGRHRKIAKRLFVLAGICAVLMGGAWIAMSLVKYNNNDFVLNDVIGNTLTLAIPLFVASVSGGIIYWMVGANLGKMRAQHE